MASAPVSMDVIVRNLAGKELASSMPRRALVSEVKAAVKEVWRIPVREQRLVFDMDLIADDAELQSLSQSDIVEVVLIRGPAFHFSSQLAHPRAILCADSYEIIHGGQDEYQAGFLSDVLDPNGSYTVPFRLEDPGRHGKSLFAEMYVGIAPDKNRSWSNLEGAYLNRLGILVDGFCGVVGDRQPFGWIQTGYNHSRERVFTQRMEGFCGADSTQVCDFSAAGHPCEHVDESLYHIDGSAPNKGSFTLVVDMVGMKLRFLTSDGWLIAEVHLPELGIEPVRCCATVGYPGQKVAIADV